MNSNRSRNALRRSFLLASGGPRVRGGGSGAGGGGASSSIPFYVYAPVLGMGATVVYTYYAFLDDVPMTHRRRWIATSSEFEKRMGDQQYQQLLKQYKNQILPKSHRASQTVERVGSRIAQASQHFMREHHDQQATTARPITPYTYTVVRSDQANAFVLPNNHVFVLTGLFDYVKDEDDLAAVLGHECAHNIARHAGERLSGSIVLQLVANALWILDPSGTLTMLFLPAAGILHTLPHSRHHETEADQIGIHLAAQACYDPRAAKRVFRSMKEDGGNKQKNPPEFLSTHPSHSKRISQFDDWLPSAMKVYKGDNGTDESWGGMETEGFMMEEEQDRCSKIRREMAMARKQAAMRQQQQQQQQRGRAIATR